MNATLASVRISMVANATTTVTKPAAFGSLLEKIRGEKYSEQIAGVREAFAKGGKEAANQLKKQLPVVMFSGEFGRRSADQLQKHSGFLCLDLDGLNGQLEVVRSAVNADPYTVASFLSPTGSGLKVIVRVPAEVRLHKAAFESARKYYQEHFKSEVDSACSDVSRLCFVSHDPALFFNPLAAELPVSVDAVPVEVTEQMSRLCDEARIRSALVVIPANVSHDMWIRVLMALHRWDESLGKQLARAWSETCPEKFKDRDFEVAWRSFKPNGGVGLGTLFEVAKTYGWRPAPAKVDHLEPMIATGNQAVELVISKWPEPPRPETFYGVLGEFVRRLEPHTESDPMAILVQAIVGFGNLIGRTAHFSVEADRHYCNLNAVMVGNSSKARKGTSWGHVNRLLREVDATWPKPITGLSTGEGLIFSVRDPITKMDKEGDEVIVDGGVADKRLLAVESEFGRMLQCANRERNTLSAVVRQGFDTGDLRVATKSSPAMATGAHISIIAHVTIVELNLLLTKSDSANGFANRFIWVSVRRSKLLPEGGDAASLDFTDIVERLRRAVEFASNAPCMRRNPAGQALWKKIYTDLSVERSGLLGAVTSRAEAMVMRVAMILAITDCSLVIRDDHLMAAVAIWDYSAASAQFIFDDSLGNPLAERVLALLQEAGNRGLPLAAIYENLSGHVNKDELHAALRELHGQGLIRFEKIKTSGRPMQVWFATKPEEGNTPDLGKPNQYTSGLNSHNSLTSLGEPVWEEAL